MDCLEGQILKYIKVVLTLKKFVFKFRCMQDILIDQLKVMFDFSNKGWVTLFKQSKCLIETILWFYDSTTCLPLFFYSSAVNYISFKCERPKNCTKIISGKHNTVLTWRQLFHFFLLASGPQSQMFWTWYHCLLPSPTWRFTGWWKHTKASPWNCGCWSKSCR